MKRFLQLSLAAFGVLSLMLAGCNTQSDTSTGDDMGTTVEGTTDGTMDTGSMDATGSMDTTGSMETTK